MPMFLDEDGFRDASSWSLSIATCLAISPLERVDEHGRDIHRELNQTLRNPCSSRQYLPQDSLGRSLRTPRTQRRRQEHTSEDPCRNPQANNRDYPDRRDRHCRRPGKGEEDDRIPAGESESVHWPNNSRVPAVCWEDPRSGG